MSADININDKPMMMIKCEETLFDSVSKSKCNLFMKFFKQYVNFSHFVELNTIQILFCRQMCTNNIIIDRFPFNIRTSGMEETSASLMEPKKCP